jgi:hypothetical protein
VFDKVGVCSFSFDFRCNDAIAGEPVVDRAEPSSSYLTVRVLFILYYSFASEDPDKVGCFGDEDLHESGGSSGLDRRVLLLWWVRGVSSWVW